MYVSESTEIEGHYTHHSFGLKPGGIRGLKALVPGGVRRLGVLSESSVETEALNVRLIS